MAIWESIGSLGIISEPQERSTPTLNTFGNIGQVVSLSNSCDLDFCLRSGQQPSNVLKFKYFWREEVSETYLFFWKKESVSKR